MFEGFANHQAAAETVRGVLEKYLSNERPFAASIDKKSLGSCHDSRGLMVVQYTCSFLFRTHKSKHLRIKNLGGFRFSARPSAAEATL